jgi:signal transduction histidine kinase/DNA-binding response OmpR family regulator
MIKTDNKTIAIKNRFPIFSALLFFIILVAGSIAFIFSMKTIIRATKGTELINMLELEQRTLESSLNSDISIILKLADSPFIKRYFADPEKAGLESVTSKEISSFITDIALEEISSFKRFFSDRFSVFWVSDVDKMFYMDDIEPYWVDADSPDNYWYNMSLYETEVYNFNINYNPDIQKTNLWINAPVFDNNHIPCGIVGSGIDLSVFIDRVYQNTSEKVDLFFFNGLNEVTGARDINLVSNKVTIMSVLNDKGIDIFTEAIRLEPGEIKSFDTPNGKLAIGIVPSLGWYTVAFIKDDIGDYKTAMTALFIVVLGLILLIFIIFNGAIAGYLQSLRETMESLKIASESKSRFIANMSHEIRTPMNAILGITEIVLRNEKLQPDITEAMYKIYNSGDLLLYIINDILDLSKIEAGKLEILPTQYAVAGMIGDTVMLNLMRIGNKPIEFKLSVDENIPAQLLGDELRIKQILNNLISNAIKYTSEGEVKLTVSIEKGNAEDSPFLEGTVTLVYSVSDTGHGMTKEQVSRLFEEYSRFNSDANRTTEGTGLGMSITHNLVHMMKGKISVESEPNKGTLVTVQLPQGDISSGIIGKELAENLAKFEKSAKRQIRKTQIIFEPMPYGSVLLVDDVESNLYVAEGLLFPYGLSIETALNGFTAIDKIKEGKSFDIIFMDHMMPKMDGIETTKKIREMGYTQPIVALTANAIIGQSSIFMENGFDGFISKPIDIRQLDTVLKKFIRDKQTPEVIEAANRNKSNQNIYFANWNKQADINPKLDGIFAKDVSRLAANLEETQKNGGVYSDEDIRTYTISTHALKSALTNVHETDLSNFAAKLEQAGREKNTATMAAETRTFLDKLRTIIEKHTPQQEKGGANKTIIEDRTLLQEKLLTIKTACETYNRKAIKEAIMELQQKEWQSEIRELLEIMEENLLNGDFEALSNAAGYGIKK